MNIFYCNPTITREDRNELNGHESAVIWLTGLSGSGKSTIALSVEERLHRLGYRSYILDGDNVRHGLSSDLMFSDSDRKENIRRVGEVSKLMMEAGIIVITAFISPFREDRDLVRKLLPEKDFIEVYCKADIEVCESRDVKGLYKLARSGKIKNYTGIDSPYESPINPEIVISTEDETLNESVDKIINFLINKKVLKAHD